MESGSESEWEADGLAQASGSGSDSDGSRSAGEDERMDDSDGLFANAVAAGSAAEFVDRLLALLCCAKSCMENKKTELTRLVSSFRRMTKQERCCVMLSGLTMYEAFTLNPTTIKGDARQRKRFEYMLSFVERVCKKCFMAVFDIPHRHLVQARQQVAEGCISARPHGNSNNQNASTHSCDADVAWYREMASEAGDVALLRVRMKKKENGRIVSYHRFENSTLPPMFLTSERPLDEFARYTDDLSARLPSLSSFAVPHLSRVRHDAGVIECLHTPTSTAKLFDLRRSTTTTDVAALILPVALSARLPDRPMKPEKLADLHEKIMPYTDVLYRAPTPSTLAQARRMKNARKEAQAKKRRLIDEEGKEGTVRLRR
ncbi:hypothetical protein PybrP1_001744 [[Pythium] brassicae (nom. inval.)]|nr:hypothetical protein PybrP1_001744 [[Pythium] brassicae (nom. inval.)]